MNRLAVLGLASFYGPAYAERAASRPDCAPAVAAAVRTDEQLRALGRPTRDEFADEYDCRVTSSVDETLDVAVDGVVVATPTSRRAEDAIAALDRGLPVLTAKPVSGDAGSARAVAEAARAAGVPATTTTPARFDDAIMAVGDRVAAGGVGDVVGVRASIRHDRVPVAGIDANAEHAPDEAGSSYAMAYYTADLLLWLSQGRPVRAFAEYENVNSPHSAHPDLGVGTVEFADGALGSMTLTYSTDAREPLGNWELEVTGTEGILRTNHEGYEALHWHAGPPDERSTEAMGRTQSPILDRQFDAFVDALDADDPAAVPPGPDAATDAIELCAAWERASAEGSPVELEELG